MDVIYSSQCTKEGYGASILYASLETAIGLSGGGEEKRKPYNHASFICFI